MQKSACNAEISAEVTDRLLFISTPYSRRCCAWHALSSLSGIPNYARNAEKNWCGSIAIDDSIDFGVYALHTLPRPQNSTAM